MFNVYVVFGINTVGVIIAVLPTPLPRLPDESYNLSFSNKTPEALNKLVGMK